MSAPIIIKDILKPVLSIPEEVPLIKNHFAKSVQIRSSFWSVFSHIRTENGDVLLCIQSKCRKMWTRKTAYLDTFYAANSVICETLGIKTYIF